MLILCAIPGMLLKCWQLAVAFVLYTQDKRTESIETLKRPSAARVMSMSDDYQQYFDASRHNRTAISNSEEAVCYFCLEHLLASEVCEFDTALYNTTHCKQLQQL
eukprot:15298-Heterococcus_DN1.PRE.1